MLKLSCVPPLKRKRGLPVVDPPEPVSRLGQVRTVALAVPVQLAEKVAVDVNVALAVRLIVPKSRLVIEKLQLCAKAGDAASASHAASTATIRRRAVTVPLTSRRPDRSRPGDPARPHSRKMHGTRPCPRSPSRC